MASSSQPQPNQKPKPTQKPQATQADSIHALPQALRTAISFVLFVHLFSVSVILLAHTGRSELTQQIRERVKPMQSYLRFLWMDLNYAYTDYRYSFTESDIDFVVEAHLTFADESIQRVPISDAEMWPEMRRQRYLTLAKKFEIMIDSEEQAAQFAKMIGSGILHEYEKRRLDDPVLPEAKQVEVQCWRLFAPGTEPSQEVEPDLKRTDDGIAYLVVYQGKVWRDPDTHQLEFSKGEARRMLAPRPPSAGNSESANDRESSEPGHGKK